MHHKIIIALAVATAPILATEYKTPSICSAQKTYSMPYSLTADIEVLNEIAAHDSSYYFNQHPYRLLQAYYHSATIHPMLLQATETVVNQVLATPPSLSSKHRHLFNKVLLRAAGQNHYNLAAKLMQAGANPQIKDKNDNSALSIAAKNGAMHKILTRNIVTELKQTHTKNKSNSTHEKTQKLLKICLQKSTVVASKKGTDL